jgi:hypothetical protein
MLSEPGCKVNLEAELSMTVVLARKALELAAQLDRIGATRKS